MAQYKVPQDVEADDKLIGPFSFRQFVYLLIAAGLIALAVGLFQIFPLLAIIPVPFVFFFLALALPLKKDQPMETYLAALVSFYLKPRTKVWLSGQRESAILITAPKKVDDKRTRDITGEEATHRLSFLADIVDTEGFAIKGAGASPMREDLVAEANATPDMFEAYQSQVLNRVIDQDKMSRHNDAVKEMRDAIARNKSAFSDNLDDGPVSGGERVIERPNTTPKPAPTPEPPKPTIIMPEKAEKIEEEEIPIPRVGIMENSVLKADEDIENSDVIVMPESEPEKPQAKTPTKPINDSIMELAHNNDFSVATIAKEANRINEKGKGKGEVFISLH